MWRDIQNLLYRILPGNALYWVIIGLAVLGILGGVWRWWQKKDKG